MDSQNISTLVKMLPSQQSVWLLTQFAEQGIPLMESLLPVLRENDPARVLAAVRIIGMTRNSSDIDRLLETVRERKADNPTIVVSLMLALEDITGIDDAGFKKLLTDPVIQLKLNLFNQHMDRITFAGAPQAKELLRPRIERMIKSIPVDLSAAVVAKVIKNQKAPAPLRNKVEECVADIASGDWMKISVALVELAFMEREDRSFLAVTECLKHADSTIRELALDVIAVRGWENAMAPLEKARSDETVPKLKERMQKIVEQISRSTCGVKKDIPDGPDMKNDIPKKGKDMLKN